ncbi:hypothetical protein LTR17_011469 [Elasticomyces elasticus]|nr:hypothetical protein LTR17_011469 [Elasticomyces elasticus]
MATISPEGGEWTTKVIFGIPKVEKYKAASYVWGKTKDISFECKACKRTNSFPVESYHRFLCLMSLVDKSGDEIWIDALSIDQTDPNDIAAQLAVMGNTYNNASCVAVLLPRSDEEAFRLLEKIATLASNINLQREKFAHYRGGIWNIDDELSATCQGFYASIQTLEKNLHKWKYWSRAWTFQEWALARNISLAWEGNLENYNLAGLKSVILEAATMMAVYKIQQGAYAQVDLGFTRGEVPQRFESVKRLFPDERAFKSSTSIEEKATDFDVLMPSMSFGKVLGLRSTYNSIPTVMPFQSFNLKAEATLPPDERFKERLYSALNALGTSRREARYAADLVCSWASMCNIEYAYDKNDSFPLALQKVIRILREKRGVQIFNFLANTTAANGEVDIQFLHYATLHRQSNATNNEYFHGAPAFTGRFDLATHFKCAVSQPGTCAVLEGTRVSLRKMQDAQIRSLAQLTDKQEVINQLYRCTSSTASFNCFSDIMMNVASVLGSTPVDQLANWTLAVVSIPFEPISDPSDKVHGRAGTMHAFAICNREIVASKSIIVAREALNSSITLAVSSDQGLRIVGFLSIADQQSGAMLLRADASGIIKMTLKTPLRSDVVSDGMVQDRVIRGRVQLDEADLEAI